MHKKLLLNQPLQQHLLMFPQKIPELHLLLKLLLMMTHKRMLKLLLMLLQNFKLKKMQLLPQQSFRPNKMQLPLQLNYRPKKMLRPKLKQQRLLKMQQPNSRPMLKLKLRKQLISKPNRMLLLYSSSKKRQLLPKLLWTEHNRLLLLLLWSNNKEINVVAMQRLSCWWTWMISTFHLFSVETKALTLVWLIMLVETLASPLFKNKTHVFKFVHTRETLPLMAT